MKRGGGSGGRRGGGYSQGGDRGKDSSKQQRESILNCQKYENKSIRIKYHGGREVIGILKGFDQLMNLVVDETKEILRDADGNPTEKTRDLGLVVCRGTQIILISPMDGMEEIANPFLLDDDDEE